MSRAIERVASEIYMSVRPNFLITITLKQSITSRKRALVLDDDQVIQNAIFLKDRLQRALKREVPEARRSKIVTFYHGRHNGKRKHLHFGLECPRSVSIDRLREIMRSVTANREWIFQSGATGRDINEEVKPVTSYDEDQGIYTIFYCLREGLDSLLPEASDLR